MSSSDLGRRIKEARLAKKMTQSDVVGDFITRNMLSQIECGNAYPSIKTLEYLAKKLEIPINQIMPDEQEEMAIIKNTDVDCLKSAKLNLKNGRYEKSAEDIYPLNTKDSIFYDESSAILAHCHLAIAKDLESQEKIQEAIKYAKQACGFAGEGIYASREIKTEALILLDQLAEKLIK